eukprot:3922599-Prymnesium_polylepis.1
MCAPTLPSVLRTVTASKPLYSSLQSLWLRPVARRKPTRPGRPPSVFTIVNTQVTASAHQKPCARGPLLRAARPPAPTVSPPPTV